MYAQTLIEDGDSRYKRGDVVPDSLPGLDDLIAEGTVGPDKPTDTVTIDTDGNIVGDDQPHIARYDGKFTSKQIADPKVETPLLGTHRTGADHRAQEPQVYAPTGDSSDSAEASA